MEKRDETISCFEADQLTADESPAADNGISAQAANSCYGGIGKAGDDES